MKREIGSFFWEYKIDNTEDNLSFFENLGKDKVFLSSGRDALKKLIKEIGKNKTILLPGFTCSSVIIPFINNGYKVHFYDLKNNLEVDVELFLRKIKEVSPDIILIHSYFGFDTVKNIRSLLKDIRKNNIIVVEDITQRIYSKFDFVQSDYIVSSLRKWFAIPDGGVLIKRLNDLKLKEDKKINNKLCDLSLKMYDIKKQYIKNGNLILKEKYYQIFKETKFEFEIWHEIYSMSSKSIEIYNSVNLDTIKYKRYKNYKYLLENLSDLEGIEIIFKSIEENIVPLYFPIFVKNGIRDVIQKKMAEKNIYCPIIWPISKFVFSKINYTTINIYNEILCIPCDQRYNLDEIKFVADNLKIAINNSIIEDYY
ncbi:DegT/DnrJ/EryC1/StrS family aminotransferase [Clostridium perfringens]|nr:DegT/DnrJ/EryC1/StrS family aminotransferase [Clostridium perfringens]